MLPLAHVGHYLWVLYLLPVAIVVAGIVKSTRAQRRIRKGEGGVARGLFRRVVDDDMRDLFPGWVPPDEETLDRYWDEATFAVDTSVLLDLYRFSEEARKGLLKALRSFEERLWIPHQVGLEFHRNRLGVLLDQREAENNLLRELDQLRQDLDKQLSQLLRGAGRRDLAPLRKAIDDGFESLKEKLKEAEKEHTKGLGESIRDDPIYEEVVDLCADRVGDPFDEERQADIIDDAKERFRTKTPPGYLDDEKDDKTKYGDVILWHQLCERALATKKPVVLIADDQKTDWIWEVRGKTIGPRPELVAEMGSRASVGFHIYTPTRFLRFWEQREGRKVEPEVLAEIEGSGKEDTSAAKSRLFRRYQDALHRLTEAGDERIDTFWSPLPRPSIGKPWPSHFIESDGVILNLEYPPDVFPSFVPQVTIHGPNGMSSSTSTGPMHTGVPGQGVSFSARYPDDFVGVKGLASGFYKVIWEVVAVRKDSGEEVRRRLGSDGFSIGGGSQEED